MCENADKSNVQEEFWKSIINKYEDRNANLENELLRLQQRVDQMDASVPAVMTYNMAKLAQERPSTDVNKFMSPEECVCEDKDEAPAPLKLPDMSNISVFSIEAADVCYMDKIKQLTGKEKDLIEEVNKLKAKEKALKESKKKIDELSQDNSKNAGMAVKGPDLNGMNERLIQENQRLFDEIADLKLELKHMRENVEGPMQRELERERRKNATLDESLRRKDQECEDKHSETTRETALLQRQVQANEKNLKDMREINCKLKEEISFLTKRMEQLQSDLINQKLSEATTLALMKNELEKKKKKGSKSSLCTCKPCPGGGGGGPDPGPGPGPGPGRGPSSFGGPSKPDPPPQNPPAPPAPPTPRPSAPPAPQEREPEPPIEPIFDKIDVASGGSTTAPTVVVSTAEDYQTVSEGTSDQCSCSTDELNDDPPVKGPKQDCTCPSGGGDLYMIARDLSKELEEAKYTSMPETLLQTVTDIKELCDLIDKKCLCGPPQCMSTTTSTGVGGVPSKQRSAKITCADCKVVDPCTPCPAEKTRQPSEVVSECICEWTGQCEMNSSDSSSDSNSVCLCGGSESEAKECPLPESSPPNTSAPPQDHKVETQDEQCVCRSGTDTTTSTALLSSRPVCFPQDCCSSDAVVMEFSCNTREQVGVAAGQSDTSKKGLMRRVTHGSSITTIMVTSGFLEIVTEGKDGIIETSMIVTEEGNIELITEVTEKSAGDINTNTPSNIPNDDSGHGRYPGGRKQGSSKHSASPMFGMSLTSGINEQNAGGDQQTVNENTTKNKKDNWSSQDIIEGFGDRTTIINYLISTETENKPEPNDNIGSSEVPVEITSESNSLESIEYVEVADKLTPFSFDKLEVIPEVDERGTFTQSLANAVQSQATTYPCSSSEMSSSATCSDDNMTNGTGTPSDEYVICTDVAIGRSNEDATTNLRTCHNKAFKNKPILKATAKDANTKFPEQLSKILQCDRESAPNTHNNHELAKPDQQINESESADEFTKGLVTVMESYGAFDIDVQRALLQDETANEIENTKELVELPLDLSRPAMEIIPNKLASVLEQSSSAGKHIARIVSRLFAKEGVSIKLDSVKDDLGQATRLARKCPFHIGNSNKSLSVDVDVLTNFTEDKSFVVPSVTEQQVYTMPHITPTRSCPFHYNPQQDEENQPENQNQVQSQNALPCPREVRFISLPICSGSSSASASQRSEFSKCTSQSSGSNGTRSSNSESIDSSTGSPPIQICVDPVYYYTPFSTDNSGATSPTTPPSNTGTNETTPSESIYCEGVGVQATNGSTYRCVFHPQSGCQSTMISAVNYDSNTENINPQLATSERNTAQDMNQEIQDSEPRYPNPFTPSGPTVHMETSVSQTPTVEHRRTDHTSIVTPLIELESVMSGSEKGIMKKVRLSGNEEDHNYSFAAASGTDMGSKTNYTTHSAMMHRFSSDGDTTEYTNRKHADACTSGPCEDLIDMVQELMAQSERGQCACPSNPMGTTTATLTEPIGEIKQMEKVASLIGSGESPTGNKVSKSCKSTCTAVCHRKKKDKEHSSKNVCKASCSGTCSLRQKETKIPRTCKSTCAGTCARSTITDWGKIGEIVEREKFDKISESEKQENTSQIDPEPMNPEGSCTATCKGTCSKTYTQQQTQFQPTPPQPQKYSVAPCTGCCATEPCAPTCSGWCSKPKPPLEECKPTCPGPCTKSKQEDQLKTMDTASSAARIEKEKPYNLEIGLSSLDKCSSTCHASCNVSTSQEQTEYQPTAQLKTMDTSSSAANIEKEKPYNLEIGLSSLDKCPSTCLASCNVSTSQTKTESASRAVGSSGDKSCISACTAPCSEFQLYAAGAQVPSEHSAKRTFDTCTSPCTPVCNTVFIETKSSKPICVDACTEPCAEPHATKSTSIAGGDVRMDTTTSVSAKEPKAKEMQMPSQAPSLRCVSICNAVCSKGSRTNSRAIQVKGQSCAATCTGSCSRANLLKPVTADVLTGTSYQENKGKIQFTEASSSTRLYDVRQEGTAIIETELTHSFYSYDTQANTTEPDGTKHEIITTGTMDEETMATTVTPADRYKSRSRTAEQSKIPVKTSKCKCRSKESLELPKNVCCPCSRIPVAIIHCPGAKSFKECNCETKPKETKDAHIGKKVSATSKDMTTELETTCVGCDPCPNRPRKEFCDCPDIFSLLNKLKKELEESQNLVRNELKGDIKEVCDKQIQGKDYSRLSADRGTKRRSGDKSSTQKSDKYNIVPRDKIKEMSKDQPSTPCKCTVYTCPFRRDSLDEPFGDIANIDQALLKDETCDLICDDADFKGDGDSFQLMDGIHPEDCTCVDCITQGTDGTEHRPKDISRMKCTCRQRGICDKCKYIKEELRCKKHRVMSTEKQRSTEEQMLQTQNLDELSDKLKMTTAISPPTAEATCDKCCSNEVDLETALDFLTALIDVIGKENLPIRVVVTPQSNIASLTGSLQWAAVVADFLEEVFERAEWHLADLMSEDQQPFFNLTASSASVNTIIKNINKLLSSVDHDKLPFPVIKTIDGPLVLLPTDLNLHVLIDKLLDDLVQTKESSLKLGPHKLPAMDDLEMILSGIGYDSLPFPVILTLPADIIWIEAKNQQQADDIVTVIRRMLEIAEEEDIYYFDLDLPNGQPCFTAAAKTEENDMISNAIGTLITTTDEDLLPFTIVHLREGTRIAIVTHLPDQGSVNLFLSNMMEALGVEMLNNIESAPIDATESYATTISGKTGPGGEEGVKGGEVRGSQEHYGEYTGEMDETRYQTSGPQTGETTPSSGQTTAKSSRKDADKFEGDSDTAGKTTGKSSREELEKFAIDRGMLQDQKTEHETGLQPGAYLAEHQEEQIAAIDLTSGQITGKGSREDPEKSKVSSGKPEDQVDGSMHQADGAKSGEHEDEVEEVIIGKVITSGQMSIHSSLIDECKNCPICLAIKAEEMGKQGTGAGQLAGEDSQSDQAITGQVSIRDEGAEDAEGKHEDDDKTKTETDDECPEPECTKCNACVGTTHSRFEALNHPSLENIPFLTVPIMHGEVVLVPGDTIDEVNQTIQVLKDLLLAAKEDDLPMQSIRTPSGKRVFVPAGRSPSKMEISSYFNNMLITIDISELPFDKVLTTDDIYAIFLPKNSDLMGNNLSDYIRGILEEAGMAVPKSVKSRSGASIENEMSEIAHELCANCCTMCSDEAIVEAIEEIEEEVPVDIPEEPSSEDIGEIKEELFEEETTEDHFEDAVGEVEEQEVEEEIVPDVVTASAEEGTAVGTPADAIISMASSKKESLATTGEGEKSGAGTTGAASVAGTEMDQAITPGTGAVSFAASEKSVLKSPGTEPMSVAGTEKTGPTTPVGGAESIAASDRTGIKTPGTEAVSVAETGKTGPGTPATIAESIAISEKPGTKTPGTEAVSVAGTEKTGLETPGPGVASVAGTEKTGGLTPATGAESYAASELIGVKTPGTEGVSFAGTEKTGEGTPGAGTIAPSVAGTEKTGGTTPATGVASIAGTEKIGEGTPGAGTIAASVAGTEKTGGTIPGTGVASIAGTEKTGVTTPGTEAASVRTVVATPAEAISTEKSSHYKDAVSSHLPEDQATVQGTISHQKTKSSFEIDSECELCEACIYLDEQASGRSKPGGMPESISARSALSKKQQEGTGAKNYEFVICDTLASGMATQYCVPCDSKSTGKKGTPKISKVCSCDLKTPCVTPKCESSKSHNQLVCDCEGWCKCPKCKFLKSDKSKEGWICDCVPPCRCKKCAFIQPEQRARLVCKCSECKCIKCDFADKMKALQGDASKESFKSAVSNVDKPKRRLSQQKSDRSEVSSKASKQRSETHCVQSCPEIDCKESKTRKVVPEKKSSKDIPASKKPEPNKVEDQKSPKSIKSPRHSKDKDSDFMCLDECQSSCVFSKHGKPKPQPKSSETEKSETRSDHKDSSSPTSGHETPIKVKADNKDFECVEDCPKNFASPTPKTSNFDEPNNQDQQEVQPDDKDDKCPEECPSPTCATPKIVEKSRTPSKKSSVTPSEDQTAISNNKDDKCPEECPSPTCATPKILEKSRTPSKKSSVTPSEDQTTISNNKDDKCPEECPGPTCATPKIVEKSRTPSKKSSVTPSEDQTAISNSKQQSVEDVAEESITEIDLECVETCPRISCDQPTPINIETEPTVLKDEVKELQKLMKQIKCTCTRAEIVTGPVLQKKGSQFESTMSALQLALETFEQKCHIKDLMIDSLKRELNTFEPIDYKAKIQSTGNKTQDYNRTILGETLLKPFAKDDLPIFTTPLICRCEDTSPPDSCDCNNNKTALEMTDIRRIGANSLLLKWAGPTRNDIFGYEIYINGLLKSKVYSPRRRTAIVDTIDLTSNLEIKLHAMGISGTGKEAAVAYYNLN